MEKKKNFSKKILMLASCIAMMLAFSVSAQEEPEVKEYTRLLFWVEDSLGNRDSCWFIGRPDATDGVDAHLGEVNLFGVPPQNPELDIRIIQRTDKNEGDCWLIRKSEQGYPYGPCVLSFPENIDLKVVHRWEPHWSDGSMATDTILYVTTVALEITATNYPVGVHIQHDDSVCNGYEPMYSVYFLHEKNGNGQCMEYAAMSGTWPTSNIDDGGFHTINSADENYWISFVLLHRPLIGIQEESKNVFILPNPTGNFVIIEGLENEEIRLFDTNGTFIGSFEITENPYRLDISNLPIGAYYITDKNNNFSGNFIKIAK